MTPDIELERHKRTWHGFTQFLKIGSAIVIIVLAGMAIFLV
jgi:hypothetical protein